ncbi:MAG: type II secretion system protein J [Phycisphaerae bacterium]
MAKPQDNPALAAPRRSGLTLMELMVAVALLSIMIMTFGMVMAESRKVVGGTEEMLRANSSAIALSQTLRTDIRCATMNGFLCIATDGAGKPVLLLSTAGLSSTMTNAAPAAGQATANATISAYGLTSTNILWHAGWLLRYDVGSADPLSDYFQKMDLADIQADMTGAGNNRAYILQLVQTILTNPSYAPASLNTSPGDLGSIKLLWKYLASNCTGLSITWTDGTTDGAGKLMWYGNDTVRKGDPNIEPPGGIGGRYCALWNRDNQCNWPQAIKFSFTLTDPKLGTIPFEVICPVAR